MKALSLIQPWADLVVDGKKTIELRAWNTNFRGEFLVHASKFRDPYWYTTELSDGTIIDDSKCERGCILGSVRLVDVKHYLSEDEVAYDRNRHLTNSYFTDSQVNRKRMYGFILDNPQRWPVPRLARGALNFWEVQ